MSSARLLGRFRITILFVAAYVATLAVYVSVFKTATPSNLDVFLTSPFSPHEDFTSNYASPAVGFALNFGVVVIVLALTETYLRLIHPSFMRINPATLAFALSIVASYALSAIYWSVGPTHAPTAGTSIIGSCMTLTLVYYSGRDFIAAARGRMRFNVPTRIVMIPTIFAVVSTAIYVAEYLVNSSVAAHLLGDALFALMFALTLKTDGYLRRRKRS